MRVIGFIVCFVCLVLLAAVTYHFDHESHEDWGAVLTLLLGGMIGYFLAFPPGT